MGSLKMYRKSSKLNDFNLCVLAAGALWKPHPVGEDRRLPSPSPASLSPACAHCYLHPRSKQRHRQRGREAKGKAGQRAFPPKNRGVGLQENGKSPSLTFGRKSQSFGKAACHENVPREEKVTEATSDSLQPAKRSKRRLLPSDEPPRTSFHSHINDKDYACS